MKKLLVIVAALLIISTTQDMDAQPIEIHGFAGWQLMGKANLYDGEFRMDDAMNYGGKLSVGLSTTNYAEISYMRADTKGRFYPYYVGDGPSESVEFSSNYIHIGSLQEVHFGPLSPFGTIGLGLAIWDPKSSQLNTKVQFQITAGAGFKIWLTDFLGIRLQGGMMMPLVVNGAGFGCGIGTGGSSCGANVYTRITPFQGEFSGGLIIKISPN